MLFSTKAPLRASFLSAAAFITLSVWASPLFAASPLGDEAVCGADGAPCPAYYDLESEAPQAYFQPAHGPPSPSFYPDFARFVH